jgi:hypothetical protein
MEPIKYRFHWRRVVGENARNSGRRDTQQNGTSPNATWHNELLKLSINDTQYLMHYVEFIIIMLSVFMFRVLMLSVKIPLGGQWLCLPWFLGRLNNHRDCFHLILPSCPRSQGK